MNGESLHNEKDLLRDVAAGDETAFRMLFDAYRNPLYFFTLQLTSSKELAEDIVQDSFLKIWLKREQLTGIDNFKAYLFRMAQNAVFNGLKRKAAESTILATKLAPSPEEPLPSQTLHIKLIKEVLQKAVDALPEQQRRVYQLRREDGRPIREIADILDISEITVKRHLTQAQKSLRQSLRDSFPEEGGILLIILGLLSL